MFTDRNEQRAVFADALRQHRARIEGDLIGSARRENVLVYAGRGGIGKTALSQRLERWVTRRIPSTDYWGPPPPTQVTATARIDLHNLAGSFDAVAALVEIRTALAGASRHWPAFDLAFAAYWSTVRPSLPLPSSRDKSNEFSSSVGEFLQDLAGDLGSLNTATSVASLLINKAISGFRRRQQLHQAKALDSTYDLVLDSCLNRPTEAEPHLELVVSLTARLTLQIEAMPAADRPLLVVFIDAFERLRTDPHRFGERLLNQLVYSMPYTLFVVTGRDLISWSDPFRTELHRCGPAIWPGLVPAATEEPRQHLFGNLSRQDARSLISRFWHTEQLPLTSELVDQLVESSDGWPLYLDVAIERARTVKRNGGTELTLADVTGSLDQLVLRVMDDMPHDERQSLRAACLLPFFNTDLVAAGALTNHGAVERLAHRALVTNNMSMTYPYRVHDEIRAVIRQAGHLVEGGWSERDWQEAATRELDLVASTLDDAGDRQDLAAVTDATILGLHLMAGTGVEPDWMPQALGNVPSAGSLVVGMPRSAKTKRAQAVLDYVLARAGEPDMAASSRTLQALAELDSMIAAPARRHFAYRLRNAGRWDESIAEFTRLIEQEKPELHRYQRIVTLMMARRFQEAITELKGVDESSAKLARANLKLSHGQLQDWLDLQEGILDNLATQHSFRVYRETRAVYLRRLSWADREILDQVREELDICERVGHRTGVKSALGALALLEAGNAEHVAETSNRLQKMIESSSEQPISYRIAEARALDAFVRDDRIAAADVRDYTNRMAVERDRFWIPTEILLEAMDASPKPTTQTQWLEPYTVVRDRWLAMAVAIRAKARVTPEF